MARDGGSLQRNMLIAAAQRFDDAILCLGSVTRRLQGEKMDPLEMAGIPGDILRLREGYALLNTTLQQSLFFITGQWPAIENNRTPRSPSSCRNIPGKCSRIMSEQIDVPYRPELSLCGAKNNLL